MTIYPDLLEGGDLPPSIIERRARDHIGHLPHVWTPDRLISTDHAAAMAVIGALRLGAIVDDCAAAWDGGSLRGRRIVEATLWLKADGDVLVSPERHEFAGPPKMWTGQIKLDRIIRTAREAWRRIEAVRLGERAPEVGYEEEQPYATGWSRRDPVKFHPRYPKWNRDDDLIVPQDLGARAIESFSATGYCALNVADSLAMGYTPRLHGMRLVGGRPMVEMLAIMGAVALDRLGLWQSRQPRIPAIEGVPLRHWYDLERWCASDSARYIEPGVRTIGRRKYILS